jgi:hypothetical protein
MQRTLHVSVYLLALLAGLLCGGCIAPVQHRPNAGLLGELGFEEAATEFAILVNGLRSPQVHDTRVDERGFSYAYAGGVSLYWGAVPIADGLAHVGWRQIRRVDVYENAKAFLIGPGNRRIGHEYLFHTVSEATRFADLIASFQAGPPPQPPRRRELSEAERSPWAEEERQRRRSGAPR